MTLSGSKSYISQVELYKATGNWTTQNVIKSGYFSTIYKGIQNNIEVAIKKIKPTITYTYDHTSNKEHNELEILQQLEYKNIGLLAFNLDGAAPCLIYPYMSNGSLKDKLEQNKPSLTWIERHEIAKGILDGLSYLHLFFNKGLVHGAVTSAHVLLDDNLKPVIADFGLARESLGYCSVKIRNSTTPKANPYLPKPHIVANNFTLKSDVYAYGVILLELATGLPPYDKRNSTKSLVDLVKMNSNYDRVQDKRAGDQKAKLFDKLVNVGLFCTWKIVDLIPPVDKVK